MAQTLKSPAFIERLVSALTVKLPRATVDVQRVPRTNRYRIAIVASQFARMRHPRRQNLVWDIAENVLKADELLKVSMIIALSPAEFRAMD
jgi:acid stress-induced BolA-like protein IbaG/YrbA